MSLLTTSSEIPTVGQNSAFCIKQIYPIFAANLGLYKTVTENTTERTFWVSLEQHLKKKKKEQTTVLRGLRVTQNLFPQFYLANEVIQALHKVALVTPVSLDAKL